MTVGHVIAVTEAAVPSRIAAIAACEPALVDLARQAQPRDVKTAVRRIADHVDVDGTQVEPLTDCGSDPRRELHLRPTIDGLHEIRGLLDQLDAEALLTPSTRWTAPTPRIHPHSKSARPTPLRRPRRPRPPQPGPWDAADRAGNRPHLLLTADLTHLLPAHLRGDPAALADRIANGAAATDLLAGGAATKPAGESDGDGGGGSGERLRWTGPLPLHRARHLALQSKLTAVLTLGPYRIVNVGRTHRTLPAWLRTPLEAQHRHCRGPDCDRPATWTQAHHQLAWDDGGDRPQRHRAAVLGAP